MSKIMNLITYDKLLKNITAIHINLICSDTFKIPLWSGWKNRIIYDMLPLVSDFAKNTSKINIKSFFNINHLYF